MAIALQTGRGKDFARLLMFVESPTADVVKLNEILDRHGLSAAWQRFEHHYLSPS